MEEEREETPAEPVRTAEGQERAQFVRELADSARARAGLYRMIASLYLKELDAAGIEHLAENMDAGLALDDPTMEAGWKLIADFLAKRDMGTRLELAVDFACSILAAGTYEERMATPYESVFTSESGLLMQEARDDVYRLMCEAHLGVKEELRTPEDHLSFECEFMAKLADRQAEALEAGRVSDAVAALRTQSEMHVKHLANWIDVYCDCLEKVCKTDFYRGVGEVTRGFVHLDADFIADSLAAAQELEQAEG